MIGFAMRAGSNFPMRETLDRVSNHLRTDRNINVKLKGVQKLVTDSSIAILGLDPDAFKPEIIMNTMDKVFDQCEREMHPQKVYKDDLQYDIEIGNSLGMPWVERKEGEIVEDNGRRCFIIQVDKTQLTRLKNILDHAKLNGMWEPHWGKRFVTVQMAPGQKRGELREHTLRREGYQKMIRDWGCTKNSISYMVMPGLQNCTAKFKMNRINPDGSPKEPANRSVKEIMENVKWNGHKVFVLVAEIDHGVTAAFFSNVIQDIDKFALSWINYATAQIFWNLRRRLVKEYDITTMMSFCFDDNQIAQIERSRWSKLKKMAVVDNKSDFDFEAMEGGTGAVDFSKGLSPEERRAKELQHGIHFAKYKYGQFGVKQIEEDISVKTATPGKTIPVSSKDSGGESINQSVITYKTKATVGNIDEEEEIDDSSISSGMSADSVNRKDMIEFEEKLEETRMIVNLEESSYQNDESPPRMANETNEQQNTPPTQKNYPLSDLPKKNILPNDLIDPPSLTRVSQEENEARRALIESENLHFPSTQPAIKAITNLAQMMQETHEESNKAHLLEDHSKSLIADIFPLLDAKYPDIPKWVNDIEEFLHYIEVNSQLERKGFTPSRIEYSHVIDEPMLSFLQERFGEDYVQMTKYLNEVKNLVKKKIDSVKSQNLQLDTGKTQSYPTHTIHPEKIAGQSENDKGTLTLANDGQVTP